MERVVIRQQSFSTVAKLFLLTWAAGCGPVLGLDDFTVSDETSISVDAGASAACTSNAQCTQQAEADGFSGDDAASICVKSTHQCARLLSEDCRTITGDPSDDDAIVLGSLFSISGPQGNTNLARQKSAALAIEEINAAGGIPDGATSAGGRRLVLVSCDEAVLMRAAQHLVQAVGVPAIIGPNTSQDTLDVSNALTIAAGVAVVSPTAVASSIADLLDNGLTWQMVPSDVQRAPLMIRQINDIETRLRDARHKSQIKLTVAYRDDALGRGTRVSLNSLELNGKPLTDPVNLGNNVRIDAYDPSLPDQQALVDAYVEFAPDIIVLVGTAEAVTQLMLPIEQAWAGPADSRPEYVLIDSSKVPELLSALEGNDGLRHRIRGTGVRPGASSVPVNDAFMVSYTTRYPGEPAGVFGMGPAYDATYGIAYAIASLPQGAAVTGSAIAQGLRRLASGGDAIEVQSTKILAAMRRLTTDTPVTIIGTFSPLQWTDHGAIAGGMIDLWCVSAPGGHPAFESSGVTLDLATGQVSGQYVQCPP